MPRPKLNSLVPLLRAVDLAETIAFYRDRLGFELVGTWPDPEPVWCTLRRDSVSLMFFRLPDEATPKLTGALYLYPDNVTAIWEQIRDNISATQPLTVTDRGQRQFTITDPNGYALHFGEPV